MNPQVLSILSVGGLTEPSEGNYRIFVQPQTPGTQKMSSDQVLDIMRK